MGASSCTRNNEKGLNEIATDQSSPSSPVMAENQQHDSVSAVLQAGQPVTPVDWDRKIIKDATLTLEVAGYKHFNDELYVKIRNYGGYIASEEQNETSERIINNITIKVPVEQFESLMATLSSGEVKVMEKRISTNDVSAEVVDTRSRIETKKQVRLRYLELLKKAKNMKEILQVQNEINALQENVESSTGRVNYLNRQSAFSTIHLSYYQYLVSQQVAPPAPGFVSQLAEAFRSGGSIIASLFLGLVTVWPLLLATFAGWYVIRRFQARSVKPVK